MRKLRAALFAALVCSGRSANGQGAPLPSSTLAFRDVHGAWQTFWNADHAPVEWHRALLAEAVTWQPGAKGLQWAELSLKGSGEAWRTKLVVARLDPTRVILRLDTAFTPKREADWTLAKVPKNAILAVNAGQFEATMPWGWVALDGRRWLPPQHGPLSAALMLDSAGSLHWIPGSDVQQSASRSGAAWAFQSYPAVLFSDSVLSPLRAADGGVDVGHRDARAGICMTNDNRLLVALTRFDAVGSRLDFVPFGLTVPEMAAVLGALGCRDAMLLDGGISARLRVRDNRGRIHDWEGLRSVPLGLVALPRP